MSITNGYGKSALRTTDFLILHIQLTTQGRAELIRQEEKLQILMRKKWGERDKKKIQAKRNDTTPYITSVANTEFILLKMRICFNATPGFFKRKKTLQLFPNLTYLSKIKAHCS